MCITPWQPCRSPGSWAWTMGYLRQGLLAYRGTHRRFEKKGVLNGVTIINDYAHHSRRSQPPSTARIIPTGSCGACSPAPYVYQDQGSDGRFCRSPFCRIMWSWQTFMRPGDRYPGDQLLHAGGKDRRSWNRCLVFPQLQKLKNFFWKNVDPATC